LGFAIWYVMRYAYRVKADPTKSVIYAIEQKESDEQVAVEIPDLNGRHKLVFLVMVCGLSFNVYGVFEYEWFLTELTASFLIMG
ncbi:C4-dicarboxylate ABC transporter permease, partial [Klebsiella pneumoniae]